MRLDQAVSARGPRSASQCEPSDEPVRRGRDLILECRFATLFKLNRDEGKGFVNHKASPFRTGRERIVVADRRIREFAPEHEREGLRPEPHANQNSPRLEPLPKAVSAKRSFLEQLLRDAALALRAGEARAAELQQEIAVLEREMAATIRSERARADAAEESAKAAEEHAKCVEQRAQAMIRSLERRAEAAEARLQAAQSWIEQVRRVVAGPHNGGHFGSLGAPEAAQSGSAAREARLRHWCE
jgi:hypothetical protein